MSVDEKTRTSIIKEWNDLAEILTQRFGLGCPNPPRDVSVASEERETGFGAILKNHVLFIDGRLLDSGLPLRGIVAHATLKSALSAPELCIEAVDDVGCEFARQIIAADERERWQGFWASQVPRANLGAALVYDPSTSFLALYDMVGEIGLDAIVRDLAVAKKYGMALDLESYVKYFETRVRRFAVALTTTDKMIIDTLVNDPETNFDSVADRLSLTPQWVSRRISDLKKRLVLREFGAVRLSRIGVRMFHLLLKAESADEEAERYIAKCPFLYSRRDVIAGDWQVFTTLAMPDNGESYHALERFQEVIAKWGIKVYLTELISSGSHTCLDYYDADTGTWSIPWELEQGQLAKIHGDRLASLFPKVWDSKPAHPVSLDELDIRILEAVWNRTTSVSKIRSHLRVGQHRVADRLRRLRKEGVVGSIWEVHHIGLTESVFASTTDREIGEAVAAWSYRLPRTIVSFDIDHTLMMQTTLPLGGSFAFASTLSVLPGTITTGLLGPPLYGTWRFPTRLFDPDRRRWLAPREQISEWMESIR